ncbi:MAG: DUF262 domain-containing HNH endonuclease family protein [Candidatus Ancillula sp.]|jgi:uncharacterized protein with ParB-like and HNH nuclease domain|nr:DUF262 domain-containing HNH endonuclease family protein [Candidatus Ancillula sp.]
MQLNNKYLLELLSNNDVTFFIPPYQRNYEWTKEQTEVLWKDIINLVSQNIRGERSEHFFGTIVYVQQKTAFGEPNKLILTDGQQRITTTMLFLIALRDLLNNQTQKGFIENRYLINPNVTGDGELKIKLKQVESDWSAYKKIITGEELAAEDRNSAVYRNYKYFRDQISKYFVQNDKVLDNLIDRGLSKFRVVTIELEPDNNPWENPQEIFESMNSLGKPLSFADLVRNYLLLGLTSEEQEKNYHDYWLPMEEVIPGRISDFIRDYMQMYKHQPFKKATESNYKELYGNFKDIFSVANYHELFESLKKYSKYYAEVLNLRSTEDAKVDRRIKDLNDLKSTGDYSFLLELFGYWHKSKIQTYELVGILDILVNFILRRRILGLTQGENKEFPQMSIDLEPLIHSGNLIDEFYKLLASQANYMRFPNDIELGNVLKEMDFYHNSSSRYILSTIEEKLTKLHYDIKDTKLQIEHIMPQTLNYEWRNILGENAESVHQELVNNIGNLTLITHNQELGNKSFAEKKAVYNSNEGLQIAKTMIVNREVWNKQAIDDRRDWLVNFILNELIPLPEKYKNRSNWVDKKKGSKGLSLEKLGLIGKQVEFIENSSITATVISNKKIRFEDKEWNLSPLTRELKNRAGTGNLSGSYQGSQYWTYQGEKLQDLMDKLEEQNV